MRRIAFCDRCRGMEVAWNWKYVTHCLVCLGGVAKSFKITLYTITAAFIISVFPTATTTTAMESSDSVPMALDPQKQASPALGAVSDPAVQSVEELLRRHSRADRVNRARIARAVVSSARTRDVDPHLVASILLVESSGDPFAISDRDAVGIMQIHVPTWGALVDLEEINLFRVEDNIDLGTRILKEYTDRYGLWDGVARYLGTGEASPEGVEYLARVQNIYSDRYSGQQGD